MGTLIKKNFGYIEASSEKRKKFLEEIKDIDPADIVFSDEAGIDDNEVTASGWALRGERCHAQKKAERNARYNIIAALNMKLLFAPFVFEGYSSKDIYETYVERVLVPALRPGMVFIIDNASFHKSVRVIKIIEAAGCRVLFLPPYSPDLNPIEHYWAAIKSKIRAAATNTQDFFEAAIQTLKEMCAA